MKKVKKSGVTLVSLVITIVILAIITGVIVSNVLEEEGVIEEADTMLTEEERKILIETIATQIQTNQLKKEVNGQYTFSIENDVEPILQRYGVYDDANLKLTTQEGQEIYLYEIMQIPMLEYAQIQYTNKKLTINSALISSGYVIEYTTNLDTEWNKYVNTVQIGENQNVYARITNKDGKVISNVIKVQEGMMQSEDKISPIIRAVPGNGIGRTIYVTIFVTEYGTLAHDNVYEYYLSTSQTLQENGEWKKYTPAERFELTAPAEGIYYLHIRGVSDTAGNISDNKVVGPYEITESGGIIGQTAPTVSLSINENTDSEEVQKTTITIESDSVVMYSYGWSNSSTVEPTQWNVSISKTQIAKIDKAGTYYLWIKDLRDTEGNKAQSININGTDVNLISGAFKVEIFKPTVALSRNSNATPAKSHSTTIKINETNNVTYSYGWSNSKTTAPTQWTASTSKNQVATQSTGSGNYYLWIKDLKNSKGTLAETVVVGGNTVNLVSEAFFVDNSAPNSFTPKITSITETSITVQGSTTDNNGKAVTYYYSKDNGTTWVPENGTQDTTYTFTNLTKNKDYNIKMKAVDTVNNTRTPTTIATTTYAQQKNYLMLYDRGDECVDVTGGWELYGSNAGTFNKNADSLSIYYSGSTSSKQYLVAGTLNAIDFTDYSKICAYGLHPNYYDYTATDGFWHSWRQVALQETNTAYYESSPDHGRTATFRYSSNLSNQYVWTFQDIDLNGEFYAVFKFSKWHPANINNTTYLYDFFAVKEDNWQTWCERGGINASNYADLDALFADTNTINKLLNNKMAVEYMIYNCTGTVMAKCMQSSSILEMIENSQYNDLITGNIHWNKFIEKFSS